MNCVLRLPDDRQAVDLEALTTRMDSRDGDVGDLERMMMELGGRCKGFLEAVHDVCYIVVLYCLLVASDVPAQIREDGTPRYPSRGRRTPRPSGLEHVSFSGFNRTARLWAVVSSEGRSDSPWTRAYRDP